MAAAAAAAAAAKTAQTSQAAHIAFNHHTALSQSQASIAAFGQSPLSAAQISQSQPTSHANTAQRSYTPPTAVTTQQTTPVSSAASVQANNISHHQQAASTTNGPTGAHARFPNPGPRGRLLCGGNMRMLCVIVGLVLSTKIQKQFVTLILTSLKLSS